MSRSAYLLIIVFVSFLYVNSSKVFADNLYQLVRQSDFRKNDTSMTYSTAELREKSSMSLLAWEMIETSKAFVQPQKEAWILLVLEIPAVDSLLAWNSEGEAGCSKPVYRGNMPLIYVKKTYVLKPDVKGSLRMPEQLLKSRRKSWLLPTAGVNKFLRYEHWQNKKRLYKIQDNNLVLPKVRLQWWYFDFFLSDGSTMVLAFIPQDWWQEGEGAKDALFMVSYRNSDGAVRKFSSKIPCAEISNSRDTLKIGSQLLISTHGQREQRQYSIQLAFPELSGTIQISPTKGPFAPWPTGVMPGYLQTLISGAPKGAPSFSYVSQIPQGNASGVLNWENKPLQISGNAYHEQGRLDDTPENQGSYWTWYHFSGEGWNIFGSPGTCIYVQKDGEVLRSGFHLISGEYTMACKKYLSPLHKKILTGGEIAFRNKDLDFTMEMSPSTAMTMISYTSSDPNQVWGTVDGAAELLVQHGKEKKVVKGRMLLETCSWGRAR